MPDRVLGPGATGAGENADQTDPAEETVEVDETPEPADETPESELRVPPTAPPADAPAKTEETA